MTTSVTWKGRKGSVLLGPTEDRVARYLADATRHGRVTIRTMDLAARLGLGRSEAYRITDQLRTLGLFGVENDQGGTLGGRRWWRTATPHDGVTLDATRHRIAWSRILAWARARRQHALELVASLHTPRTDSAMGGAVSGSESASTAERPPAEAVDALSFRDRFLAAGGGSLLAEWRA